MVALLMLAYALSFVDRQILALLVEPVTSDLQISDTAFGVLQGTAFAIFYIGFGFPLGRLADGGNRRNLIVGGILVWSLATMACGTAASFSALFAWRAVVGIGEAALSPAAFSMIADVVPKRRLSLALAFYSSGVYLGSGLALLAGGLLIGWLQSSGAFANVIPGLAAPWRILFLLVGLPGVVMALILLFLPEPQRRHFSGEPTDSLPSIKETFALVAAERRLFAGFTFGFACHNMALYALLGWFPTFISRHHGVAPSAFGTMLGAATMIGGVLGLIVGGIASDRLIANGGRDVPIRVAIASMAAMAISSALALHGRTLEAAAVFYGAAIFSLAMPIGTAAAALQLIVPNRYRGQVSALYLITVSLAGLTLGPLLPPLISDQIFGDTGRIGDALSATLTGAAILSIAIFLVGRPAYARRYTAIHLAGETREAALRTADTTPAPPARLVTGEGT